VDDKAIIDNHKKKAISIRLAKKLRHSYLGDFILGAIDGTVTTFALIAGVAGAGLRTEIAFVLGLANLLGDGFSMAVGNYLRVKSDRQLVERARKREALHIEVIPEGEREEVRQIFAKKGFKGRILEEAVSIITRDKKRWIDTMITEEHGLSLETPSPIRASLVIFSAFCALGLVPLLPLLMFSSWPDAQLFLACATLTAMAFLSIGMIKGFIVQRSIIFSGLETLIVGGAAATLAFLVGTMLKTWI